MSNTELRRLALDWLKAAAQPSGASLVGTPPPWVQMLLRDGLVRREAVVAAPLFKGARAVRTISTYVATVKGQALIAVELHKQRSKVPAQ